MFNTDELDRDLDTLPHPLPSIITAVILTLVEERRAEVVQTLCGGRIQLCVNNARPTTHPNPANPHSHDRLGTGLSPPMADAAGQPQVTTGRMVSHSTDERSGAPATLAGEAFRPHTRIITVRHICTALH